MATGQVTAGAAGGVVGANALAPIILYYSQVKGWQPPMEFDTAFAAGSLLAVAVTGLGTWVTLLANAWYKRKFGKYEDPADVAGT